MCKCSCKCNKNQFDSPEDCLAWLNDYLSNYHDDMDMDVIEESLDYKPVLKIAIMLISSIVLLLIIGN